MDLGPEGGWESQALCPEHMKSGSNLEQSFSCLWLAAKSHFEKQENEQLEG